MTQQTYTTILLSVVGEILYFLKEVPYVNQGYVYLMEKKIAS